MRHYSLHLAVGLLVTLLLAGLMAVVATSPADAAVAPTPSAVRSDLGGGNVLVTWDEVNGADRYFVRWVDDEGNRQYQWVGESANPSVTLPTPKRGVVRTIDTEREIEVQARNLGERSRWVVAVEAQSEPVVSDVERDAEGIRVSWTMGGDSNVVRYVVKYRRLNREAGEWANRIHVRDPGARSGLVPLENLDVGSYYEVAVRAVYADGQASPFSSWQHEPLALTTQCQPGGGTFVKIGAEAEYPEKRIPVESQVWFFPTDRDKNGTDDASHSFGHAHLLTCVPFDSDQPTAAVPTSEPVTTSKLKLDLHYVVHLNDARTLEGGQIIAPAPGTEVIIRQFEIRGLDTPYGRDIFVDQTYSDVDQTYADNEVPSNVNCRRLGLGPDQHCERFMTCEVDDGTCMGTQSMDVNLDAFATNGRKQLRIAAVHEIRAPHPTTGDISHVGATRAIIRVPFNLQRTEGGYRQGLPAGPDRNINESSGWLIERTRDGAGGYASAGFSWPDSPDLDASTPVVQGQPMTLNLQFETDSCAQRCAVDEMPPASYAVFLNPGFHNEVCPHPATCEQRVRLDDQNWTGDLDPAGALDDDPHRQRVQFTLPASVTNQLTPGLHKLVLATEQPMVDGQPCSPHNANQCTGNNGTYVVDEEWSSTLTGILVIYFTVAPS